MSELRFGSGETFLVVGLGRSGIASADVLGERGATVYAIDEKPRNELSTAIAAAEAFGAHFIEPPELDRIAGKIDCAVLSPGVPLRSELCARIRRAGISVVSEIEVAYRICTAPFIAVTGTKGKSTTTALIAHLLRSAGKRTRVGGNIGDPLIREAAAAHPEDWVVSEISSFQLETIDRFHPRIAVILNISADHLDRYDSLEEYAEAKYRVLANQNASDTFVGNLDDARSAQLAKGKSIRAQQRWFSFGERPEAAMYFSDGAILYQAGEIVKVNEIPLAGPHNIQNVMAASLAAIAAGMDPADLRSAIGTFAPMPHRLQAIGEVAGVSYVDDSKATNPAAAIAALRSFVHPIVLIAGGRSKRTDFRELGRAIDERAKAVVLIGESAEEIAAHVHRARVVRAQSIEDAVRQARSLAQGGDVVLLSPACASFDMFSSAEERGTHFARAVHALPEPIQL